MRKHFAAIVLALGVFMIHPIYGQKSTEVFIPIGKSPGLSGKYSVIGKIVSFDEATRMLTISAEDGEHSARITEKTKMWLDKTAIKKTSQVGSLADCQQGRLCEVKYVYEGKTRKVEAEWIKIGVSTSD